MCLPGLRTTLGSLLYLYRHGGPNRMVGVLQALYRDHDRSAVVQLRALQQRVVVIYDPAVWAQVHRAAGSCPWGATDALWPLHRYFAERPAAATTAMSYGTSDWMRVRRALQPSFFSPQSAAAYAGGLDGVALEASRKLGEGDGGVVEDLQAQLQRLSFEMICTALFGRRLGTLEAEEPLLAATVRSMECASGMLMSPLQRLHAPLRTRLWRDWTSSLDVMLVRAQEHVAATVDECNRGGGGGGYVGELLERGELTPAEIETNIPGLMMGGFETVAATLHWALIHLARNPAAQEVLRAEVHAVMGPPLRRRGFTRDLAKGMPYLRAVLRETQRLTPTAFTFLRRLDEPMRLELPSDAALHGSLLPAGAWLAFSPVGFATDPALVEAPAEFLPERWLEGGGGKEAGGWRRRKREGEAIDHPLMRDGFGFGPRMCLGARLARLELECAVSAIVSEHAISVVGSPEFGVGNHASTFPDPAPTLRFTR
jgi:cytochrome P450